MPNKITGPNAGGLRQLPIPTSLAARVGQFCRWAAERASENPKPRRSDMSIANDVHKNISQPCRGGTRLRWAIHAAPMGLGTIIGLDGCYKHGAPTELGLARLPWSGQSPTMPEYKGTDK